MASEKRIRRTPDEARRVILDAAESSLGEGGPAAIRLQEVARLAGVSHPTILHHFGSREGLIRALNRRTIQSLRDSLMGAMHPKEGSAGSAVSLTFEAWRGGLAQRMVWLLQSTDPSLPDDIPVFEEIVETLHAVRTAMAAPGVTIDRYDTRAIVHLTTVAAIGDALAGDRLRRGSGETDQAEGRRRFELWLANLINLWIVTPPRG